VVLGFGTVCLLGVAREKSGGAAAPVGSLAGSLMEYEIDGGEGYLALSLRGSDNAGRIKTPHDHAVIIDTSASQTGAHRQQGLAVLEAFVAALPAGDRVNVVAIDVAAHSLSNGFHAAGADETKKAIQQLRRRVPLGATDLGQALRQTVESFPTDDSAGRARSIVVIGDGMSTTRLIDQSDLKALVAGFRERHIPIHSYAIGPRTDLQLLGLLAAQTGGVVLVDELVDDASQSTDALGKQLAQAADATVFYPDSLVVEPALDNILPAVLPIRGDRDTVILGKGRLGETLHVKAASETRTMEWTLTPAAHRTAEPFLAALWTMAERSEGLFVSVAGKELLNIARREYEQNLAQLVGQGERAVAARDLRQAEEIARTIRELDPENVEAETILNASQKVKAVQTHLAHLEKGNPAPAAEAGTVNDSDLTEIYKENMRVRTERLTKEVNQTIEAARKTAGDDPDAAIGGMKRVLNTVTSAADIDPIDRETLRRRTQNAIDEIAIVKQQNDLNRVEAQRRRSAVQARQFASDELIQRQEELEQLIEKVRSLLSEGFAGNEAAFERAEAVARAAWEKAPYLGVTAAAVFDSEAAGQLDKVERLRYLRADKFLETLGMVEKAHVPFPDEPPIVWPAPEVWRDLTVRRKKWASVDLMQYNKAETKIREMLDKPTEVNFNEQPLEEAIRYLAEYHGIDIVTDKQALLDTGVALDQPVSLQLSGATFRSTLKLLLEPLQLTWLIEDEVMKITTAEKASEKLSVRVYPVADLVIPVTSMGGGMMGGMGMMGGGMGMMGGGMGMMGGGMGGGMMGGMGMMYVADDAVLPPPAEFNNATVRDRKKKLAVSN
jgi:hypothetical protein